MATEENYKKTWADLADEEDEESEEIQETIHSDH